MSEHEFNTRVAAVAFFLLGAADDKQMYNAHSADHALTCFCKLVGLNEAALKLHAMGFTEIRGR